MKQFFRTWADRLDGMALRERAILFFAFSLILLFVFNALFSGPITQKQREIARQLAQKQVDTRTIQEQTQQLLGNRTQDPDDVVKARIANLKERLHVVETRLAQRQRELVPPEKVTGLLEDMLRRERKLELVELKSMPPVPLFDDKTDPSKVAQMAPTLGEGAAAEMQVYRHGVEVTVRGSYLDLLSYLGDLEKLPVRMFWREVEVAGENYPMVTMKLHVYTLSLDRSWVVV